MQNVYSTHAENVQEQEQERDRGIEQNYYKETTIMVDKWHWIMIQVRTSQSNKPTDREREWKAANNLT